MVSDSRLGSVTVTIQELFSSSIDPRMVKQVFLDKTLNASSHWLGATYHLADIQVTGTRWGLVSWLVKMGFEEGWVFSIAMEWM